MVRVTLEDGSVREYRDGEVIEIENFPPRDTPAPGYERTREYPPEYRRATPLNVGVLTVGRCIAAGSGFVKVVNIEQV